MTRRQIINTSWDCFDYLKSKQLKGMKIHFVAVDDIYTNKKKLENKWFKIRSIPYIRKQHCFKALSNKCLAYALTVTSHQRKILLSQEGNSVMAMLTATAKVKRQNPDE
ncbi:hypothetical protein HHI36_010987 [Cryptolaemus montrouzieri]|uniref:Uncharacterized protein n=1 Tax=Cryptolaemus montrouzieri TaxID=559131 RepID=A0ABD2MKE6_9CUCU